MTVLLPADMPEDRAAEIEALEKTYAQDLQRQRIWRHLWRVAGSYSNLSIFDCRDNAHLHEVLTGLPLYPWMKITVSPLCRHPSTWMTNDADRRDHLRRGWDPGCHHRTTGRGRVPHRGAGYRRTRSPP
ncbi:muconolactone delta-isomerase [Pseudotabrizicola sediminis]|uniref:Muconolactone delta-isomerase n=1 Tax=Pseudotabrizicola sediminis TaxID=2486418 RepID=A0ABY2KI39_9RHOB|nr:muconolactone delta-isomerase [Pseudotabrizicola sediminis]